MEFGCIEFVAAGWGTGKWSKIYQTITNLTSGDMGISLLVIQLGVTGLKKIRLLYLLGLFQGRGEKGQCDLVCGASLGDWANGGYVDVLFTCGECGFSYFGPVLRSGCGIK